MLPAATLLALLADLPPCDGFDFPVGAPDAEGYYDAQPFGVNQHLGQDWNGEGGGDTDLGDPVHVAANGVVTMAEDREGGWGKVVMVVHHREGEEGLVETLYAHLDEIDVQAGQVLTRGEQLGTIGDAHGVYIPHLHFELRERAGLGLGPGYALDKPGWVDPQAFIEAHRPLGVHSDLPG
jgi:murein DD-endopeptidase MepM/ murein hydrolase activator NlpD